MPDFGSALPSHGLTWITRRRPQTQNGHGPGDSSIAGFSKETEIASRSAPSAPQPLIGLALSKNREAPVLKKRVLVIPKTRKHTRLFCKKKNDPIRGHACALFMQEKSFRQGRQISDASKVWKDWESKISEIASMPLVATRHARNKTRSRCFSTGLANHDDSVASPG